ncbi:hypothetical protein ROD_40381 [Citrobacter rodentium ICC168]|uniref:Uncharacterized protein n=1 Tax=Citrobacter rodentium (strain ICC168) TaxID=637910 RepID=D2THX4_CITRI|nr:hypothetical protein ROD_40381 [Citrobacter rodentium ICC168]
MMSYSDPLPENQTHHVALWRLSHFNITCLTFSLCNRHQTAKKSPPDALEKFVNGPILIV